METNWERGYQDGQEDLAQKITELIYGSDYEITLQEIIEFLEWELSWKGDEV